VIASFIIGFVAGIIALLAFAVQYFDRKVKPQATQRDNRIAATSVSMDPNAVYSTTLQEQLRIFQIPPKGTAR
jgi:hypothetical protein